MTSCSTKRFESVVWTRGKNPAVKLQPQTLGGFRAGSWFVGKTELLAQCNLAHVTERPLHRSLLVLTGKLMATIESHAQDLLPLSWQANAKGCGSAANCRRPVSAAKAPLPKLPS